MNERSSSAGRAVIAFVLFCLTTVMAIILLLTAVVVWISELTGSIIFATVATGGVLALLSVAIYGLTIREKAEQIRSEIETVYDVARLAKEGYDWVREKLVLLMMLREKMQKK